jgi:hypothetical protein
VRRERPDSCGDRISQGACFINFIERAKPYYATDAYKKAVRKR